MKANLNFIKPRVKELTFASAAFLLVMTTLPESNNSKHIETKNVVVVSNNTTNENTKEDDTKFLVHAAEINLEAIYLGQLAQNNSKNSDIKSLGKMMETEHSKFIWDLKTLASKKQITIPSLLVDKGKAEEKKLINKFGSEFDKEFCNLMVADHKDVLEKFQKASVEASDSEIRSWASIVVPTLRTQLACSITCQKSARSIE